MTLLPEKLNSIFGRELYIGQKQYKIIQRIERSVYP